jgi:hypothetical protein
VNVIDTAVTNTNTKLSVNTSVRDNVFENFKWRERAFKKSLSGFAQRIN